MAAFAPTAARAFPCASSSPASSKAAGAGVKGIVAMPGSSAAAAPILKVQAQAQAAPVVNGRNALSNSKEIMNVSAAPLTFCNPLPDQMLDSWKAPKRGPDMLSEEFGLGKIMEGTAVFRQIFAIRSYEIGADKTASIETLMNHLQETSLNHAKAVGLLANGFGATPEMHKRDLIWVVGKIQLLAEHYPSWWDLVQVDTWVAAAGKNGMRRDWHVTDYNTGKTILRGTSTWVMMNKVTRKLSRMPDEVRAEIGRCFLEQSAIREEDHAKMSKPWQKIQGQPDKQFVREGLTPRWGDLDVNQHVNNVKYIGWLLESAPVSIMDEHELSSMTLEYRKECGRDSVLQSTTTICDDDESASPQDSTIRCQHLLQLECGAEIVKAVTQWRPKHG